jgi:hypothetical protein
LLAHCLPVPFETAHDRCVIGGPRTGAPIDDDIDVRKLMLMLPEGFANQPFDPIAPNGATDNSCRHREPKTSGRTRIRSHKNRKHRIREAPCVFIDAIKVRFIVEALRRSERPR